MPDWSQIKNNLKMLTSETNLAPVIKPFENKRQNTEKKVLIEICVFEPQL